jgi:hypothetical protein
MYELLLTSVIYMYRFFINFPRNQPLYKNNHSQICPRYYQSDIFLHNLVKLQ